MCNEISNWLNNNGLVVYEYGLDLLLKYAVYDSFEFIELCVDYGWQQR